MDGWPREKRWGIGVLLEFVLWTFCLTYPDWLNSGERLAAIQRVLSERHEVKKTAVNQKLLERSEGRIKRKQDKRAQKEMRQLAAISAAAAAQNPETASTNYAQNKAAAASLSLDVQIENFDVFFAGKPLLQQADLMLAYGRRYGLIGRNGVGKSTLLRALARREFGMSASLTIVHVEQEVVGDDTPSLESVLEAHTERHELLQKEKALVAYMDAQKQLGREVETKKAMELAQVYSKLEEIEADKAPALVAEILNGLSFTQEMQSAPTKSLSGGWRMRLALARALFMRPELLLLDEPTNMLDVSAVLWLENYLQDWPHTIFTISHDRDFLNSVCTDIIHMHHARLEAYKGDYDTFEKARDERILNQAKEYEAQLMYRQHLQAFIDRWRVNANRAAQAQSKIKILEKLPELKPIEKEPEVQFRFPDPEPIAGSLVHFDDVVFQYSNDKPIFTKLNFGLRNDSRVAVVGANGNGKTTLLKLITGDLLPTKGESHRHRALRIGYFSQYHVDQLDVSMSAVEFLHTRFPGQPLQEYRRQLGTYGMTGDTPLQPIRTLSGGQKSRVAFTLLGMQKPHFLILDEPTNHLDIETVEALANAINAFSGGVVLVSHDERLIRSTCTEIWVCERKSLTRFEGSFGDYKAAMALALRKKTG
ncbi:ATP-binding cassette sub-family F member 3, variant [Capsaspora owczarzaki ATCC 30864]|uniref:ATP-binding cassette sub-family F member 3, variant n=1 Tax=Capsaspora owczarzaki (strain ATCC 30864) TaxID=595528 RepID=A0A0D2WMC5_CAPO3|nr:ATP-binding cassette sub-family F member 3, variant [Capsaspora owczarzaki ATCC 30864]